MDEIRDENWRYVAEESDNNKKIHALRWQVYFEQKEELSKREFLVSVPHPKWGNIVWTCVKDHIIDEKEKYEAIGLHGFDYRLFEDEEGGGTKQGLDRYYYLKHIIKLWTGDWVKQMKKMNEAVGMKNRPTMGGGGKRLVCPFRSQQFWECISCIIS